MTMPSDHTNSERENGSENNLLTRTRDLRDELEDASAGEVGVPVDARCTGCKQVRLKRASTDDGDVDATTSFKHICHKCKRTTWWNVLNVLEGLVDQDDDQDDAREGSA